MTREEVIAKIKRCISENEGYTELWPEEPQWAERENSVYERCLMWIEEME